MVDSETPGSKTNALAGSSSTSISVSGVTTASPGVVTTWFSLTTAPPVAVTFFFSSIFTVKEPWVTAAGVTLTSPPITMVPVLALTTTFAAGREGSTSMFSKRLTNATFWLGSLGDLTFIDDASKGTATLSPNISFMASEMLRAVLKSP